MSDVHIRSERSNAPGSRHSQEAQDDHCGMANTHPGRPERGSKPYVKMPKGMRMVMRAFGFTSRLLYYHTARYFVGNA
jgi:hypothetical protein